MYVILNNYLLILIISLIALYTAKKTDIIEKIKVNTGNLISINESNHFPPKVPPTIIIAICIAILEYFI